MCSASNAYNSKLAHLINAYLANVLKNEEENCGSTVELLAGFDRLNEKKGTCIEEECFVGSTDFVALYPSLDIDKVTIGEIITKSPIILGVTLKS